MFRDRNPNSQEGGVDDERALAEYLRLIERDMAAHPEHIRPLSGDLLERALTLVGHLQTDLHEDLPDVDL